MHPRLNLNPSHFLPRTLVLGSPFYNNSDSTFQTPLTPTIVEIDENIENLDSRTIKISNLNENISISNFLQLINGSIENCYFENNENNGNSSLIISFINSTDANNCFYQIKNQISIFQNNLNSPKLSIKKKTSNLIPNNILNEINKNGATRSISISNLPNFLNQSSIIEIISKFGIITSIQQNLNSIFISFTSIESAINCKLNLPTLNTQFSNCKILYSNNSITPFYLPFPNFENRSIFIGNLSKKTSIEDICNIIRAGPLENIKLINDKGIAFLTFLYHQSAVDLLARSMKDQIFINSKPIKVSWANNSGPLDPIIAFAASNSNASRNLYIGINEELENIDDYDLIPLTSIESNKLRLKLSIKPENEFKIKVKSSFDSLRFKKVYKSIPNEIELRKDMLVFGEIEQINYFNNSACAFVNFTSIRSAINAVEQFNNPALRDATHAAFNGKYEKFKIYYGKDRCANQPKSKRRPRVRSQHDQHERSESREYSNNKWCDPPKENDHTLGQHTHTHHSDSPNHTPKLPVTGIGITSPTDHRKLQQSPP